MNGWVKRMNRFVFKLDKRDPVRVWFQFRGHVIEFRGLPATIMSRLSRPNFKGRESIFHGGPEQYYGDSDARCPPDLEECVMAMEDCCEEVSPDHRHNTAFS